MCNWFSRGVNASSDARPNEFLGIIEALDKRIMMTELSKIPLRQRKYAQTKLALMNAAKIRMEKESIDELSIKQLCEQAMVSEATFFNYFPKKSDLLQYVSQLWALEVNWHGLQTAKQEAGLAVIRAIFERTALQIQDNPGLMGEIMAQRARNRDVVNAIELTLAEKLLAFPQYENIQDLPDNGLESLLVEQLENAVDRGELPENTHINNVMVALVAIFYGVPFALRRVNPQGVKSQYQQQLGFLWAGVRALAQRSELSPTV